MIHGLRATTIFAACILISMPLYAQGGPRGGQGFRGGRGLGQGPGHGPGNRRVETHDSRHDEDREVFQFLLSNHDKITRRVKQLPDGVETLTESDTPEIVDKIQEHVLWMKQRIENADPIRMRDPLFAELFRHTDKIKMAYQDTEKGVRVTETSTDPYVAKLIKEHAKVVSGFVERGFAEAMKNHPIPHAERQQNQRAVYPRIKSHGAVIQLPEAAHQPRPGTKLLIDITQGSEPNEINSAIERVAKYVNLYAGAGKTPADAEFAVVFHGDATLAVLNHDAYVAEFDGNNNPNLDLLHRLHESGVEIFVCGQSLFSKDASPDDVAVFIDTAVSALTVVANLQSEGYAYLPLLK